MSSSRAGALVALAAVLWTAGAMQAGTAHAFKSKNHVIIANRVLDRVNAGDVGQMDADLRQALRDFPAYFRAGTLGPDNFPDIVAGQVWVHVNNGEPSDFNGNRFVDASVPMEQRPTDLWRSISTAAAASPRSPCLQPSGARPPSARSAANRNGSARALRL